MGFAIIVPHWCEYTREQSLMALTFHPRAGMLLMCDFNTGFKAPEMIKKRPVVVVSRKCSTNIVTVVPLSTVEPVPFEIWHWEMSKESFPESLANERCWAKCDMVTSVALWRLDRIRERCRLTGARTYLCPMITAVDLSQIQQALRHVMSL